MRDRERREGRQTGRVRSRWGGGCGWLTVDGPGTGASAQVDDFMGVVAGGRVGRAARWGWVSEAGSGGSARGGEARNLVSSRCMACFISSRCCSTSSLGMDSGRGGRYGTWCFVSGGAAGKTARGLGGGNHPAAVLVVVLVDAGRDALPGVRRGVPVGLLELAQLGSVAGQLGLDLAVVAFGRHGRRDHCLAVICGVRRG